MFSVPLNFVRRSASSSRRYVVGSLGTTTERTLRFKSTLASTSEPATDDSPDIENSAALFKSNFVQWDGLADQVTPTIQHVRSFPIIGSAIPQLSGTPSIDPLTKPYDFWREMHNRFGEFYTFGNMIGGNPEDIFRTTHVVNDPREFVNIIRAGGKYPSGVLQFLWVNERWSETRGLATREGIHGRGEEWKRIRSFLQTDLLHPESARGYLPGIIQAAALASKGAPAAAELQSSGKEKGALNSYLNRCAFDMFSSMMMGIYTETADITTPTDPENERFVKNAVQGLGTAIAMLFSPYELIVGKLMKIETARMKHCFEGFDVAWAVAQDKIDRFVERKEKGQHTANEQVSYLARALDRQKEDGSNVTVDEVKELAFISLFAAVDTTSSVLGWNLFHIARSPSVQEKLHKEISTAVQSVGNGRITAEVLNKRNCPYLHAVVRETQRLTPPSPLAINKTVDVDNLQIHGEPMEKGSVVMLEAYTPGMNPELVDAPEEYRPERWLEDAVEARKGTPSEVLDHPFMGTPFSQGARKCPGSRVAMNEIHVLLSQLVLDYKIASPVSQLKDVHYKQLTTIEVELPDLKFEQRL